MKIKDRGYWVAKHFYWQSMVYYLSMCVRFRSVTFFSAVNPAIDLGGMLDENKTDIYKLLPEKLVPKTIVYNSSFSLEALLKKNNFSFPLICKPNIGLKGLNVVKVDSIDELSSFLAKQDAGKEWLIQEFIDYEKEFSILYYKLPHSAEYGVTSFIEKKYPFVTGDGKSTLSKLIDDYKNPFVRKNWVRQKLAERLDHVPHEAEIVILDSIGNYSQGASFHSLMDIVDDNIEKTMDGFFRPLKGIDFFRADLKANSLEDFLNGDFKVLEINGAKAEPLHIYDPKHRFFENVRTIHRHWVTIINIVKERRRVENYKFPSASYGFRALYNLKKLMKSG